MITKTGKHHFKATYIRLDRNGNEMCRRDDFRFVAKDWKRYEEQLLHRFEGAKGSVRLENVVDLDA